MCSARELIFLKRKVRSAPRAVHFIFYNKNSTLVSNHYRVFHTNKISRAAIRSTRIPLSRQQLVQESEPCPCALTYPSLRGHGRSAERTGRRHHLRPRQPSRFLLG